MKLLIITAIIAFGEDIKKILDRAAVRNFSFREVTGYSDTSAQTYADNWFASEVNETESVLYYAFTQPEHADAVVRLASAFNRDSGQSHIHVAVLNIENSNLNP
ncbi:Lipoprotein [Flavobacterium longum]|uniref:hypothetical protein n=1 Tax=Flavobacterium longum TaxID=1299340 RepID=UPI0039E8B5BB